MDTGADPEGISANSMLHRRFSLQGKYEWFTCMASRDVQKSLRVIFWSLPLLNALLIKSRLLGLSAVDLG